MTLTLALIIVIGLLLLAIVFPFFASALAEQDLFWCTVPEGQLRIIVSSGQFRRAFANIKGWHVNDPMDHRNYDNRYPEWQMIQENNGSWGAPGYSPGEEDREWTDSRGLLAKRFGIYWFGISPIDRVLVYKFEWNKWKGSDGDYDLVPKTENIKTIFFQFPYAIRLTGLEMSKYFPITLDILAKIRIVNPERAFFKNSPPGNWLTEVVVAIAGATRDFVGGMSAEQLSAINFSDPNDTTMPAGSFMNWIFIVNNRLIGIGVEIYGLEIKGFEVEEDKMKQALEEQELERQRGQAAVVAATKAAEARREQAKGEADAIILEGQAKAEAATRLGNAIAGSPNLAPVLTAQAVAGSKVTTWVQGGSSGPGVVIPISPPAPPNTP